MAAGTAASPKNTGVSKRAHPAKYLLVAPAFLLLAACGLLVHGTSQNIVCVSSPPGAMVTTARGKSCTTPCTLTLERKKEETITIEKDGYEPVTLWVRSFLVKSSAGQVLLPGGLICWAVDIASGGAYRLAPACINVDLVSSKEESSPEEPAVPP